jgi:DNA polymerase (family X)
MPIQNTDIANIFNKVANLLDIEGANPFRVRAYRNAARTLSSLPRNVSDMIAENHDLTNLAGIGKDLAGKIKEIVETGSLSQLEEIESKTPAELNRLMKISGLGPKRVKALHRNLGISGLKELREAAEKEKIRELDGFGPKMEQAILEDMERMDGETERIKLPEAEQRAGPLLAYLKKVNGLREIIVAGSFRRRKETVGDLDILVTCKKGSQVMDRFADYEDVRKVISKGKTRSSVVLRSGLQVDLRVVPQVSYGAALHYFTGSKSHNIAVRKLAVKKGLKINEYGVFKKDKRIAGKTEKEVYDTVKLAFIEPELRENRGEVEAAQQGRLPDLIKVEDLRGDLHTHTKETDGHNSLEEMAKAAKDRGYEYMAITEHSKKVTMAKGLDAERLKKQITEIDHLNEKLEGITVLKGIEVDILKDGSLDLPDDILKELDLTVCSVHYNRNLSEKEQTERIIRAMDNPYFNILGHPTGRLINEREPYRVDMRKIMEAARDRGCFLEINAHPDRLDLPGRYCKMARDMGLKMVISTDAHSLTDLDFMRFGVDQARRGWLEARDVLNTRSLKQLKKMLKRTKR